MKRSRFTFAVAALFGLGLTLNPVVSQAGDRSHSGRSYSGHYSGGHGYSGRHHYRGGHGYRSHRNYSGHRYGYGGHRSRHGYRHHGGGSAWVPFAILGGAALAYTVSKSADRNYAYNRTYSSPSSYGNTGRHGDSGRPCHVVHRVTEEDGGQVKMAATMCYDEQGTSYIVKGSEHLIARLN